jgi:hypothetical protein
MRRALVSTVALVAASLAARPAVGQQRVRVTGHVVEEETSEPIAGADIIVRTRDGRFLKALVADDLGRFSFEVSRVPSVTLRASRIGYVQTTTPVLWFDDHDYFDLEVRLDREAVLLAPLEVVARSDGDAPVLAGFRHRLERSMGLYVTRADIERRNPAHVTDLLTGIPGVHLTSSGRGTRRVVTMLRGTRQSCPVQVFLDGLLMTVPGAVDDGGVAIDEYASPLDLEGIEIYRGLSTVPAELLTPDAECGVIALWTRRGH